MKRIILNYDETTQVITTPSGAHITTWPLSGPDLVEVSEDDKQSADVTELVKLGVTPADIIKMKNHGVL